LKLNDSYGFGYYSPCKLHSNCIIKNSCTKIKCLLLYDWCFEEYKKTMMGNTVESL
jgi:hypothetical protein